MKSKTKLIDILLDETVREDERDDAAIDLGNFEVDEVVQALFTIAMDISYQAKWLKVVVVNHLLRFGFGQGKLIFFYCPNLKEPLLEKP